MAGDWSADWHIHNVPSCFHGDRFGDMRLMVGSQVVNMWHALKEKKGNFIPDLIGSLLEMTLLKQTGTAVYL